MDTINFIEIAKNNLIRLNNLRKKGKLNKITWTEFFTYKNILITNDDGTYSNEIKKIIYNK